MTELLFKKLLIKNFEDIEYFEHGFEKDLVAFTGKYSKHIIDACSIILGFPKAMNIKMYPKTGEDLLIKGVIVIDDDIYTINVTMKPNRKGFDHSATRNCEDISYEEFKNRLGQLPEEEGLSYYSFDFRNGLSERLRKYKFSCIYYDRNEFSDITCGVGETGAFRKTLRDFVKGFSPRMYLDNRLYQVSVDSDGKFITCSAVNGEKTRERKNRDFDFLCFLSINEFWHEVEDIRDINHVLYPMFIYDDYAAKRYIHDMKKTGRQIFISSSDDSEMYDRYPEMEKISV